MNDSLLLTEGKQGELLPAEGAGAVPASFFAVLEARGEFTGQRLWEQRPDVYKAVVALSAQGESQARIAEMCGVSHNTVRSVQRRERVSIDVLKKVAGEEMIGVAGLCASEMAERLSDPRQRREIAFRDLAIAAGIMAQRGTELMGESAVRVESKIEEGAGVRAFAEVLKLLGTGLAGGTAGANSGAGALGDRGPGGAGGGPGDGRVVVDVEAVADLESGGGKPK